MPDPARSRPAPVSRPCPGIPLRAAVVALLILTAAGSAAAQSEPTADKVADRRLAWLTQLTLQDVAGWEADAVLGPRSAGLSVGNFQDPSVVLRELGPVLDEDYKKLKPRLSKLAEDARSRRDEAQKDWNEVVRQRAAFRQYAEKQQATYGFDFESGTYAGFKPTVFDAMLLVWACAVALVALRLRAKEQRLEIRKAQRAAAAVLLLGLVSLPGCGSPSAADPRPWAVREETELNEKVADAAAKAAAAEDAANKKWQATADAWTALVAGGPGREEVEKTVRDGERDLRDRVHGIAIDARMADRLAKDAEEQRAKLADEKEKLDGLVSGAKLRGYLGAGARVLLAGLLFGLSIAPFWSARRARAKRLRTAARTCPRCFRLNTLKVERAGGGGGGKSRYRPKGKKKRRDEEEEDEEELPEDDDGGEARCTKCGLRIRKSYLTVPRLCFPTVGVRSSGKTHMLVTAYDRIRKRTAPTVATVQPAPSGGDVDRRFDQMVDEILHRRGVAGATDLVLPDPILIHVKDQDQNGGSSALVNLFDYSGELINPDVDVNMLKATAVRMDGFMLFLDPTQLYGDGANVTLDQQLQMLDEFLAHMRKERKIPVGESIPVPVAVCVPKFDLLLSDNPIGGQSVQYIRELTENLNPPPKQVTYDVIRERSDLVEQMLPLMFPGADIREIVEGYFGKQVMFFPMSSVSLFEHELGVHEMDRRSMAPFGVAEPMMWLLHMHGYEVFA